MEHLWNNNGPKKLSTIMMRRISSWNAAKIRDNKGISTDNLSQDLGESTSVNSITSDVARYYNNPLTTKTYTRCEK